MSAETEPTQGQILPPEQREPALGLEPEQLLLRRTGIGGSEIAVLAGLSRWTTPIAIWEAKVLDHKKEPTLPMELGNLLEEPIATLYRRKTGKHTARVATLRHPHADYRFAVVTPDRGVYSGPAPVGEVRDQGPNPLLSLAQLKDAEALFQAKSTTWRMAHEWGAPDSDEVPADYLVGEVWGMGITDLRRSDFGVLFDKDRFETYSVLYQQQLFEDLYAIAERFMVEHVLTGVPPPPDASDSYREFIKRVFPKEEGDRAKLEPCPAELVDTVRRYGELRGAAKTLEVALELYRSRIQTIIGAGAGFFLPFGKVTWTKDRDSMGVDWRKAAFEARTVAQLLLTEYGNLMPVEQRDALVAQLRELEAKHQVVKRKGGRKLLLSIAKEFRAQFPDPRALRLSLGAHVDPELPPAELPAPTVIDVQEIIDGVNVPTGEES